MKARFDDGRRCRQGEQPYPQSPESREVPTATRRSVASVAEHWLLDCVEDATARLQRGEKPEVSDDSLIGQGASSDVAAVVPLLSQLHALCQETAASAEAQRRQAPRQLGDFCLLHEIGHGGMGVVYKARQISRSRTVAVKVLPAEAMLDEKRRRRFQNEIRAVATLDHAHIVPIYEVGSDQGVPYFAMRWIDGASLAELVEMLGRALPPNGTSSRNLAISASAEGSGHAWGFLAAAAVAATPDGYFRAIARLAWQAADALQHAHALGVIHRDIKPSNLLVTPEGHLWVADFGLARLSGDTMLTQSGEVLGTLRFMSPEQAAGNVERIDHRTDIYSLGATLYELLTLQPAFDGRSREAIRYQIERHEPRSPRRIVPSIPRDLEKIVLKAMAKEPEDRFATAREMADDLSRFLQSQPIRAKPPGVYERLGRRIRRHAGAVVAALLILFLMVVVLSTSVLLVIHEGNRARQAAGREYAAAREAEREREEVSRQRERAETNFRSAHAVVDRFFDHAENDLADVPGSEQIRHDLLEDSLSFYELLSRQQPDNQQVAEDAVRALERVGTIHLQLGNRNEAEKAYLEAQRAWELLSCQHPQDPRWRVARADNLADLAHLHASQLGSRQQALQWSRQRVALFEELVLEYPAQPRYVRGLAAAHRDLATLYMDAGWLSKAGSHFQEAARHGPGEDAASGAERGETVATLHGLGRWLHRTSQLDAARRRLEQARSLALEELARSPHARQGKFQLVQIETDLGHVYCRQGDRRKACELFELAVERGQALAANFPHTVAYQTQLSESLQAWSEALDGLGDHEAAGARRAESSKILQEIDEQSKGNARHVALLAENHEAAAWALRQAGRNDTADLAFRRSEQVLAEGRRRFPQAGFLDAQLAWLLVSTTREDQRQLDRALELARRAVAEEPQQGEYHRILGAALYRAGRWEASAASLRLAESLQPGGDGFAEFYLAMAECRLGNNKQAFLWFGQAREWMAQNRCDAVELASLATEATNLLQGDSLQATP